MLRTVYGVCATIRYCDLMRVQTRLHNRIVTAFAGLCPRRDRIGAALAGLVVAGGLWGLPAAAQTPRLDELFSRLHEADPQAAVRIEREIDIEWSKSGSAAMDLLLQRGKDALDANDPQAALEHLTALTDHDPDFAEGWNSLAAANMALGKLGPAVDALAHALLLNPRHFGALVSLGQILEEIDRPQKALDAYKAALELNPQMSDVKDAVKRIETDRAGQDI